MVPETRVSGLRLSERLPAIASMVNADPAAGKGCAYCLCDVGTDHAHIPIRLLLDGRIDSSIAMDVIEGPLEKARQNIELYGMSDKICLRLSDGLDAYAPGEATGLVIAGMGGRIMSRILLREPEKTLDFEELILQPQADPEFVRRAIRELGLYPDKEKVVLEDGKYYPVMHVTKKHAEGPDWRSDHEGEEPDTARVMQLRQEAEDLFGPVLIRERDSMLRSYLLWQKGVNDRIRHSLLRANDPAEKAVTAKRQQVERRDQLIRAALAYFDKGAENETERDHTDA